MQQPVIDDELSYFKKAENHLNRQVIAAASSVQYQLFFRQGLTASKISCGYLKCPVKQNSMN
jgi:hypothetical protein